VARPPDAALALEEIRAGADVTTLCQRTYRVPRGASLDPAVGHLLIFPPAFMLVVALEGLAGLQRVERVSPRSPIDIALEEGLTEVFAALKERGARPVLESPTLHPVEVAVVHDLRSGESAWTRRLVEDMNYRVPPHFLTGRGGLLTELTQRDDLWALLLAHGLDPEGRDRAGHTHLSRAIRAGDGVAMRRALDRGADPNGRAADLPVVVFAVDEGATAALELLLKAGARPVDAALGPGTLHRAVRSGDPRIVLLLLEAGLSPDPRLENGLTPLDLAWVRKRHAMIAALTEAGAELRGAAAAEVAASGDTAHLVALLTAGADPDLPDRRGRRPLNHAIEAGDLKMVGTLLEAGADPLPPSTPHQVKSPFLQAQHAGEPRLIALVESHTDPGERAEALGTLLRRAEGAEANALLARGADPWSALLEALIDGDEERWRFFIDRGAPIDALLLEPAAGFGTPGQVRDVVAVLPPRDAREPLYGQRAMDEALKRAEGEVIEALLQAGLAGSPVVIHELYLGAVASGDAATARQLVRAGLRASEWTLRETVAAGEPEMLIILAEAEDRFPLRMWKPWRWPNASEAVVKTLAQIHVRKRAERRSVRWGRSAR